MVSFRAASATLISIFGISIALITFVPTTLTGINSVELTVNYVRDFADALIRSRVQSYINTPIRMNQLVAVEAFRPTGTDDPVEWRRLCFSVLRIHSNVPYLQIAYGEGGRNVFYACEIVVDAFGNPQYHWYTADSRNTSARFTYSVDNTTTGYSVQNVIRVSVGYDVKSRPWYRRLIESTNTQGAWSLPYLYFDGSQIAVTAGVKLFSPLDGSLLGVAAADYVIASLSVDEKVQQDISAFLQEIAYGKTGKALVVNLDDGSVLGVSWKGESLVIDTGNSTRLKQISDLERAREIQDVMSGKYNVATYPRGHTKGNDLWVSVFDVKDGYGLNWVVIVVIPSDDFLGDVTFTRNVVIIVVIITVFVLVVVCVAVAHVTVMSPVLGLCDEMYSVALMEIPNVPPDAPTSRINEIASMQNSFRAMVRRIAEYKQFIPENVLATQSLDTTLEDFRGGDSPSEVSVPATPTASGNNTISTAANSLETSSNLLTVSMRTKSTVRAGPRSDSISVSLRRAFTMNRVSVLAINVRGTLSHLAKDAEYASQLSVTLTIAHQICTRYKSVPILLFGDRYLVSYNAVTRCVKGYNTCKSMIDLADVSGSFYIGASSGEAMCGDMRVGNSCSFAVLGNVVSEALHLADVHRDIIRSCQQMVSPVPMNAIETNKTKTKGILSSSLYTETMSDFVLQVCDYLADVDVVAMYILGQRSDRGDSNEDSEWMYKMETEAALHNFNEALLSVHHSKRCTDILTTFVQMSNASSDLIATAEELTRKMLENFKKKEDTGNAKMSSLMEVTTM